jgi:hypothetical protein
MKRWVGPCTYEEKPALILSDVREAMFADFQTKNPTITILFSQWKVTLKTVAWNIRKAYRSTCLDRVDVSYKWHRETLLVVAKLLGEELTSSQEDADDDDRVEQPPDELTWVQVGTSPPKDSDGIATGEPLANATLARKLAQLVESRAGEGEQACLTRAEWVQCGISDLHSHHYIKVGDVYFQPAKPLAQQLVDFALLDRMSHVGNALVCSKCLGDATTAACLDGDCERCGFWRFWSKGLRPRIKDDDAFWGREINWDTLKPGGDQAHGSSDNDLRHTISGTLMCHRGGEWWWVVVSGIEWR